MYLKCYLYIHREVVGIQNSFGLLWNVINGRVLRYNNPFPELLKVALPHFLNSCYKAAVRIKWDNVRRIIREESGMREVLCEVWLLLWLFRLSCLFSFVFARRQAFPQTIAHSVMSLPYSSPLGFLPSLSSSSLLLVNLQERQSLPLWQWLYTLSFRLIGKILTLDLFLSPQNFSGS